MKKFSVIARAMGVAGLAAIALMPMKPAFAADQLTVVSWGGSFQASQRKAYFEPFSAATGIKITEGEWNGEIAKIRAMFDSNTVSWDVVDVGGDVGAMCASGILETIDWNKLGLDPAKFKSRHECGVPTTGAANVIAYDKDRLANGPKTIADFFDLKKFPGKRGLNKNPQVNLEWALIADGVPTQDVYKVLNTPEGIERAFKKLDTIKKSVVWWTSGAQPPQLLADGQVVMSSAWNGRIYDAVKSSGRNLEIVWDAPLWNWDYWVIPKGTGRLEEAYKFIAFSSLPKVQAEMTHYLPYAPANEDATALIDPAILVNLPSAPDHMKNALDVDVDFWTEKGAELDQRFSAWLAK